MIVKWRLDRPAQVVAEGTICIWQNVYTAQMDTEASATTSVPVPVDDETTSSTVVRGVILVSLAVAAFMLVHSMTLPTLPILLKFRGASEGDIALIVGMIGVVSILTRPLSGWLIDTWGRRQMLAASLVTICVVALGYGGIALLPLVGLLRALQGTAVGVMSTASSTYVSDVAPVRRRAELLGYVNASQTIANSLGPTLGFALLAIAAPAWLATVTFFWPDLWNPALADYNFTLMLLAMVVLSLGGAFLTMFAPEPSRFSSAKRGGLDAFISRRAAVPFLLMTAISLPYAGVLAYMPFFAEERQLGNVGLYFTLQALGAFAAGVTTGRIADVAGRRPVILFGLFLGSVAMFMLAAAVNPLILLASAVISGFAQGAARNSLAAYTADRAPASERGAALSTYSSGFDVGVSLGAALLGFIVPQFGYTAGFTVSAVVVLAGAVFALFSVRDVPAERIV